MSNIFISTYAKLATIGSLGTKIFPSVTMAQAILESDWGQSFLATSAHNFFGIKADASWTGPKIQRYDAAEGSNDYYRVYSDASQSFRDHINFFYDNERYHSNPSTDVFDDDSPEQQCKDIAANHYASDPAYADKLINLINTYDLKKLDQKKSICEQVLQL